MKKYVFAVRDKKLGAFGDPVFKVEDVEHVTEIAVRSLKDVPVEQLGRVRDQALYYLGEFDDVKAEFSLLEHPEKICDYEDYLPRVEKADGK